MPNAVNIGTGDIPLGFAKKLSELVNKAWEKGSFQEEVTPVTLKLLNHWFGEDNSENRNINFHLGQRQAILNTIYVHEVLKSNNIFETYKSVDNKLYNKLTKTNIDKDKFTYPKYAMKMATGTGKTWVMHALLIWQYINAVLEETPTGRYSKNFLIIAPGLIVCDRLLDAYAGKLNEEGSREIEKSDIAKFKELFLPEEYRELFIDFLQTGVIYKEDIGRQQNDAGFIALCNWHLFLDKDSDKEDGNIIDELLPITPGVSAGHSLDSLDNRYFKGGELEYLMNLDNMVVFNDEAHHIHENNLKGKSDDVEWQKALSEIAKNKGTRFIQIDFSATPYNVTGSGQRRTKHYFPHIIVDFGLKDAINNELVKMIVIDKREGFLSKLKDEALDFKTVRDGKTPIALSKGQETMIKAGIKKLKILEREFEDFSKSSGEICKKYPKMLIMCEDTKVSPLIKEYLVTEIGLSEEDVLIIDSNKKGEVTDNEWRKIKDKLFNIDAYKSPKVIISVLMLREGFDVNNICVIVPLRSSEAPILLEQTVGRGLRLMWREEEFVDLKHENYERVLKKKKNPKNYLDILSIVEHPRYIEFYNDLINEGLVGTATVEPSKRKDIFDDIMHVGLKTNYKDFDFYIPYIVSDEEDNLDIKFNCEMMEPYKKLSIKELKEKLLCDSSVKFFSEEITVKTRFGEYKVEDEVFSSNSYNELISKLVKSIILNINKHLRYNNTTFPFIQVNNYELAAAIDAYIRNKLFDSSFDPIDDNNWRILVNHEAGIIQHIMREFSKAILKFTEKPPVYKPIVEKRYFSEVKTIRVREKYSLQVAKSIYERLPYPTNKGGFERDFMEYCDRDGKVDAFIKIKENFHDFAYFSYIRDDGNIARYYPDFLLRIGETIFVVETKAQKDLENKNVQYKKKAVEDALKKINKLDAEDRMGCEWKYVLLGEDRFYRMKNDGNSVVEILN